MRFRIPPQLKETVTVVRQDAIDRNKQMTIAEDVVCLIAPESDLIRLASGVAVGGTGWAALLEKPNPDIIGGDVLRRAFGTTTTDYENEGRFDAYLTDLVIFVDDEPYSPTYTEGSQASSVEMAFYFPPGFIENAALSELAVFFTDGTEIDATTYPLIDRIMFRSQRDGFDEYVYQRAVTLPARFYPVLRRTLTQFSELTVHRVRPLGDTMVLELRADEIP